MLGLIIFGTRGVRSTKQQGQFYCPQCNTETQFKQKKVTQFFTLYFIPLIPLGNKGSYVECQSCRNTYVDRILEMRPEIEITQQQPVKAQIESPKRTIEHKSEENDLDEAFKNFQEASAKLEAAKEAQRIEVLSEKEKVIKKLLIMMILADGKVEDSEIHMFHKVYRKTTGGAVADIYKEIEMVKSENKPPYQYLKQMASYLNEEGKVEILKASMMIAAADGDIDPSEISMVQNFGKALEMKPAHVRAIMDSIG